MNPTPKPPETDENAHAPDEWMSLGIFEKGTRAAALLLDELAGGAA